MGLSRLSCILLPLFTLSLLCNGVETTSCRIKPPYNGIAFVRLTFEDASKAKDVKSGLLRTCELKLMDPERGFTDKVNDLLLNPSQLHYLISTLGDSSVTVLDHDVGATIRQEAASISRHRKHLSSRLGTFQTGNTTVQSHGDSFFERWHDYEDLVNRWMQLNRTNSQLRLEVIGQSVEKRPIYAMRIGKTNAAKPVRVLINGMQHAREWISTMAALYAAENFAFAAENRKSNLFNITNEVEIIVLPMVNPDGFVYSVTTDRMWRKNRQGVTCTSPLDLNAGVDLNRNWGKDFGGPESTSSNPCDEIYTGNRAFSEPETAAVRDFVLRTPGIRAHVDVHSFTQLVIGPWGYTSETPPRVEEVDSLGEALARDLSSGGKIYKYGRGADNGGYLVSGSMPDWIFDRGIMSFTFELRPQEWFQGGFLLPQDQILPTCKENFAALTTLVKYANNAKLSEGNK